MTFKPSASKMIPRLLLTASSLLLPFLLCLVSMPLSLHQTKTLTKDGFFFTLLLKVVRNSPKSCIFVLCDFNDDICNMSVRLMSIYWEQLIGDNILILHNIHVGLVSCQCVWYVRYIVGHTSSMTNCSPREGKVEIGFRVIKYIMA